MLIVKEIPVNGVKHPKPKSELLPTHEFTMGLIAPKGAGKTTLMINLLLFYKRYFHRIIIFSPTIKNDEKWNYTRSIPFLAENKQLKKVIKKISEKDTNKEIVENKPSNSGMAIKMFPNDDKTFTGLLPDDCYITEYDPSTLARIVEQQQGMIDFLEENGYTKHVADRILIIFDDLVGSLLFTNKKGDTFKTLNTNHRHMSVSIFMVSQAYKEIPKTVRTNFTCLILFKIFSAKEIEAIHEEYPMDLQSKEWEEVYNYCTNEPHGFMFFDIKKKEGQRIMKNFTSHISIRKNK